MKLKELKELAIEQNVEVDFSQLDKDSVYLVKIDTNDIPKEQAMDLGKKVHSIFESYGIKVIITVSDIKVYKLEPSPKQTKEE